MTNKYLIYEIQKKKKKLIWFYKRGTGPKSQWLIVPLKEQMLQNSMPIMLHLFQQKNIFSKIISAFCGVWCDEDHGQWQIAQKRQKMFSAIC